MRLIARLDVKNEYVIKGIHLEGLRKVGNPNDLARHYYSEGADEILFMDSVASLYDRNNLFDVIQRACAEVFIPITVGGGLRSLEDIEMALHAGADKVSINTAAVKSPDLIKRAALKYGSQSIVASIEAKQRTPHTWEAYVYNGREKTGLDVIEWAKKLEDLGAGELLITSIDREGTKKGVDIELAVQINQNTSIPIIVSGGVGSVAHIVELAQEVKVSAVACASVLHYKTFSVREIKTSMKQNGIDVRL